jgi:hypothetical protein
VLLRYAFQFRCLGCTMQSDALAATQGTPALIAIDAEGRRRRQHLGHLRDAER